MADFLYNGVQLPELPEVEGYPYKYAFYHTLESRYVVTFRTTEMTVSRSSPYGPYINDANNKRYALVGDKWVHINYATTFFTGDIGSFKWANHTIYYSDGTEIYLAKSPDPVPVTPVQINPSVLLSAFFTGQAVKRMR